MIYFDDLLNVQYTNPLICSYDFYLKTVSNLPKEIVISDISVSDANGNIISEVDGIYHVDTHQAAVSYYVNGDKMTKIIESSKSASISISVVNKTQSTITIQTTTDTDSSCKINSIKVNNIEVDPNGTITFDDYYPGFNESFIGSMETDMGEVKSEEIHASTLPLNLKLYIVEQGPCYFKVRARWDEGDANIRSYGFYASSKDSEDGQTIYENDGLFPNHSYTVNFRIRVRYNSYRDQEFTSSKAIKTSDLTWDNTPVATSLTSARLMTTTNCNSKTATGFEWKRYDAPESLSPNRVECPIVDGVMAGSLRNLNSEVYYKYRPYYTLKSGAYSYGDWCTFFTGDANVYFEPDVRTYANITQEEQTATITGYVLAGSDEITEQGFEYRRIGSTKSRSSEDWIVVESSGVLMTVTLTDLEYSSTYVVRTYAKTAKGTFYGDEQQFNTPDYTGVESLIIENAEQYGISVALRENPATSTAWLKVINSRTMRANVYIMTLNGAIVVNTQVLADEGWQPIELNISHGTYIMMVTDGLTRTTHRLIVR